MTKQNEVEVEAVSYDISGLNRDNALFELRATHGLSEKEAKAYYKANKPEAGPSWKEVFYTALSTGPMSEQEFDEIIDTGTDNVIAHKSAHKMVWLCAQRIWDVLEDAEDSE